MTPRPSPKKRQIEFATAFGDKCIKFWRCVLGSDETKIELSSLISIITFEGKWRSSQAREHHPNCEILLCQHHLVGLFFCRWDRHISQNGDDEQRTFYGNTEATYQNILQEVCLGANGLPNGHHKVLISFLLKMYTVGKPEKACLRKTANELGSVTPVLSGAMGQNSCPRL